MYRVLATKQKPLVKTTRTSIRSKQFHTSQLSRTLDEKSKQTITISTRCYENLKKINQDAGILHFYFTGVFNGMAKEGNPQPKPSDILKFIADRSDIDEVTNLDYMPATHYYDYFIKPTTLDELDKAFAEKYNQKKNISETWLWFNDYFQKELCIPTIVNYKKWLVEQDVKRLKERKELAHKGIFFTEDDTTIIINPSHPTSGE